MKFLADTMHGSLAKWLRLLGYDTVYRPDLADPALAQLARAEDRILLTRDVELTRRRELQFLLIASDQTLEQLAQVMRELDLHPRDAFSRCAECNVRLKIIAKQNVRDKVPPYVWKTQSRFKKCPRCQRIYWRGTHWLRIKARIEALTKFNVSAVA
jgi:uncharacterized protein with PIN domain